MRKPRLLIVFLLLAGVPLLYYVSTVGTISPAAQTQKLTHKGLGEVDHWSLEVGLQDFRSVAGGQPAIPQQTNRTAHLKATLITQGKAQGSDWLQTCRFEKIDQVEYSWKRVETRATLLTLWDTVVGKNSGLRSLKVRANSSSPWLQSEILGPVNAAIWPELPEKSLSPGESWETVVPLQLEPRELAKALPYHWKFHWKWRPPIPGSSQAVATLDFQAEPQSEAFSVEGSWTGEILYSVPDQRPVGARGQVKLGLAAPTGQPDLSLQEKLDFNYELLRLLPGSTEKSPPASLPGAPALPESPAAPPQTP